MTFPAGGGNAGTSGGGSSSPAAPSTPNSDAPATPSTAASDSEEAARAAATVDAPDEGAAAATADAPDEGAASTSTAAPPPKIERPASFREALDRERASASEGDDTATEKPVAKKPAAAADAATPKPDTAKPAPAKTDAAKPATEAAPKTDAGTTAADAATTTAAEAKQAKPVQAPEEAEDDAPSDEEILASENLDEELDKRFPEADKGKRGALDFAKRTARKNRELAPIAELVESVGGMDGAKLAFDYTKELTALSRSVATPEEAFEQAEGFRSFLHKNAPGALGKLESAIFWKAVEDTPEGLANVQALTDEIFGDGVLTVEQLKILGNAFADGQIDLDELAERGDYTMSKTERERKARENVKQTAREKELEARLAAIEGDKKTTDDAKEETRVLKVKEGLTSFVQSNLKLCIPILRDYGLALPDDPNSPEFKSVQRKIRHIQRDLEDVMAKDDDYQTVVGNINRLQTDGVHSISLGTAQRKMQVALRAILDEYAPEAAEAVKRKNKVTAALVNKHGKSPTTTAPAKPRNTAPPADASNSERAVSREERRQGIARSIEEARREQANA